MEENKEPEVNPEDLKLLIEQNEYLKYVLKVMNGIPLNNKFSDGTELKEEDINYEELWNNVSLEKKIDAGDVTPELIAFYFNLISSGYDNFGLGFLAKMANSDNDVHLYNSVVCFLEAMTNYAKNNEASVNED